MTREEREKVIQHFKSLRIIQRESFMREGFDVAIKALEQEPRKGHWIFKKTAFDKFGNTVECSSCHKKWKTYDEVRWRKENKYCPNCGTEMSEVEE